MYVGGGGGGGGGEGDTKHLLGWRASSLKFGRAQHRKRKAANYNKFSKENSNCGKISILKSCSLMSCLFHVMHYVFNKEPIFVVGNTYWILLN